REEAATGSRYSYFLEWVSPQATPGRERPAIGRRAAASAPRIHPLCRVRRAGRPRRHAGDGPTRTADPAGLRRRDPARARPRPSRLGSCPLIGERGVAGVEPAAAGAAPSPRPRPLGAAPAVRARPQPPPRGAATLTRGEKGHPG